MTCFRTLPALLPGALVMVALSAGPGSALQQPQAERPRARDLGIQVGVLPTGPLNAITDVEGVLVGQVTVHEGTASEPGLPRSGRTAATRTASGYPPRSMS